MPTDDKATDTTEAVIRAGHKRWERVLLGDNSVEGTFRVLIYIALYVVVFGTLFHFAG